MFWTVLIAIFLLLGGVVLWFGLSRNREPLRLDLTLETEIVSLSQNQDVRCTICLSNVSNRKIMIPSNGSVMQHLQFRVINDDNEDLAVQHYGDVYYLDSNTSEEFILPGAAVQGTVLPSLVLARGVFGLGRYTIQGVFRTTEYSVESNKVTVLIVP